MTLLTAHFRQFELDAVVLAAFYDLLDRPVPRDLHRAIVFQETTSYHPINGELESREQIVLVVEGTAVDRGSDHCLFDRGRAAYEQRPFSHGHKNGGQITRLEVLLPFPVLNPPVQSRVRHVGRKGERDLHASLSSS